MTSKKSLKYPFLENEKILKTEGYPLLDDFSKAKGKPMKTSFYFDISNLEDEHAEEIHKFLSHTSLKQALKETFNISSPQVTTFVNNEMFTEKAKEIEMDLPTYLVLDILSTIFLESQHIKDFKPNYNDFLYFLERRSVMAMLSPYYNDRRKFQKLFHENFTFDQVKTILENSAAKKEGGEIIKDMLAMYLNHDTHYNTYLKTVDFKNKDNFRKIHDLFAAERRKIQTKNYELKQELHHPKLEKVHKQLINKEGWGLMVAQDHHELIEWGTKLGHCIGSDSYAKSASLGHCILIGLYEKENLKYTMEIVNKRINQIQGLSRSQPPATISKQLHEFLVDKDILR